MRFFSGYLANFNISTGLRAANEEEDDTLNDPEYNFLEENEYLDDEELQINKATRVTSN